MEVEAPAEWPGDGGRPPTGQRIWEGPPAEGAGDGGRVAHRGALAWREVYILYEYNYVYIYIHTYIYNIMYKYVHA